MAVSVSFDALAFDAFDFPGVTASLSLISPPPISECSKCNRSASLCVLLTLLEGSAATANVVQTPVNSSIRFKHALIDTHISTMRRIDIMKEALNCC